MQPQSTSSLDHGLAHYVTRYGAAIVAELQLQPDKLVSRAQLEHIFKPLREELYASVSGRGPSRSPVLVEMVREICSQERPKVPDSVKGNWICWGSQTPPCLISSRPDSDFPLDKYADGLWFQKVTQVIALESAPWWPEQGETATLGDVTVETQKIQDIGTDGVVARLYQCVLNRKDQSRPLTVLRLFWEDNTAVTPAALVEIINRFESVAVVGPSAVHCKAGLGRSGTFVAVRALVQTLQSQHGASLGVLEAGICSFVAVRAQRSGAVEHPPQFANIFEAGKIAQGG